MAIDLATRRGRHLEVGANIELNLGRDDWSRLRDVEGHAPFLADLVVEPGLRVVRTAVPTDASANIRAQRRRLDFSRAEVAAPNQLASLRIDVLDKVDVFNQAPNILQAKIAIVDEHEATLVGMNHQLLAVAFEHYELSDRAVEIPGVVRQLLIVGLQLAGIEVKRNHRGGIQIVPRAGAFRFVIGT